MDRLATKHEDPDLREILRIHRRREIAELLIEEERQHQPIVTPEAFYLWRELNRRN